MHKYQATSFRYSPGEAPSHASTPTKNTMCATFKVYEEVPKTVPLNFTEDDVTWVASNLSGAAGTLGAEAVELRNCIICIRCASEELRAVVFKLDDCMIGWITPPLPGPPVAH